MMKKLLLSLMTLIAFTSNMWGWTEGLRDSDEALGVGEARARPYDLPAGKSNPTKFHFSVASFCYWFNYDVKVRKYTSSTSYTEETRSFSGKGVQTYQEATVELSHNVIKVAIINTNDVANEYIHDVVWEGEDPAVGNCISTYDDIDDTTVWGDKTTTISSKNTKSRPIVTFNYKATEFLGIKGKIELLVNGTSVWSTKEHGLEGHCSYQCAGDNNTIQIKYWGMVRVTNIKLTQAKYVEINDDSDILFGDVKTIGSTWDAKTFSVKWASYHGKVTCTSNQFTVSPETIGNTDDCMYKDNQIITVSFNPTLPGLHTGYVYVGNDRVKITGEAKLAKPAVTATATGKGSINLSWNALTGADSYNIYAANGDSIDNVKDAYYTISGLDEKTKYGFKIKGISGVGKDYDSEMSDVAYATTYTTSMATEITGIFGNKGSVSVTSTAWNVDEKSYAIGSTAKVAVSSLPANCEVDSIAANGVDVTTTAQFEVIAENSVVVTYRYAGTGVAEVIDSHGNVIYGTLTDAVDQAEDGADINLLGDVAQDLTVNKHIFFNGNGFKINNLYIKKNGNVELTGDVNIVMDFGLEVRPDKAGQYDGHSKSLTILGDAYIDVQFDEVKRDKWYAFSVPFSVKMNTVKNAENLEAALVYGKDYIFLGFDGEARSKGEKGWITYNTPEILEPGQLYMIGTDGSIVHRFYKIKESALVSNVVSFNLDSHVSTKSSNLSDWNAFGNSQLFNVDADQNGTQFDDDVIAQVYQSASDSYLPVVLKEHVMGVTNPIFVQKTAKCSNVSINKAGGLRSAVIESALYNIQIKKEGAEKFDDQMFVSASDNAPSTYIAGYALMKLGLSGSIAQIYSNMYNTNLCMVNAPYAEDGAANIPLTVYAPAAGNYTLSLGKEVNDGTTLMLVKDGAEIHNFNTDGAYTLYLAKGNNSSYSLRIVGENGEILTPVVDDEAENVKVYVKEGVLVIEGLASGEHYMVGNVVRALYRGTSNGGDVRIALPERGVYWVNAGSAKVKVLNK